MNNYKWTPLALALAMSVSLSHATSSSTDVDIDNDGLIEISSLQELDLMRYDLAGTSLNGNSAGCPATDCNGYELVADLDFDTNGNGVADAGDLFWNNGEGWEPIGSSLSSEFTADFKGNGHSVENIWILHSNGEVSALFGYISFNKISDLSIISPVIFGGHVATLAVESYESEVVNIIVRDALLTHETGNIGGLISRSISTAINSVSVEANITTTGRRSGWNGFGGLVGYSSDLSISKSEYTGLVQAGNSYYSGGLVGFSENDLLISDSLVMDGNISSSISAGGIVGGTWQKVTVENSLFIGEVLGGQISLPIGGNVDSYGADITVMGAYWNTEVSGIHTASNGEPKTTSELQCPTAPGDVSCDPTLFTDWDETVWDFGTSSDYPVLR